MQDRGDNNDGTVTDKATGLMWQKSGSSSSLYNDGAKRYIKQLNKNQFAGHSNWRMPTVEELASLIKKSKTKDVHIDSKFDVQQVRCWTVDTSEISFYDYVGFWIVDFKQGTILEARYSPRPSKHVGSYTKHNTNYVKAVRSVKSDSEAKQEIASIPKDVSDAKVSLRSEPMMISGEKKINNMLVEYGFFDMSRNIRGSFNNEFIDNNDGIVTDKTTGLMWQKGGSSKTVENWGAKRYIKLLNKKQFAGYSDWRMPTVEELASLIKKDKTNGVHIDPVFDSRQKRCWTVDMSEEPTEFHIGAWFVDFKQGTILKAWCLHTKKVTRVGPVPVEMTKTT